MADQTVTCSNYSSYLSELDEKFAGTQMGVSENSVITPKPNG